MKTISNQLQLRTTVLADPRSSREPKEHTMNASPALEPSWRAPDILARAWQKVPGFKGEFWLAATAYVAVEVALRLVVGLIGSGGTWRVVLGELVVGALMLPMTCGLVMVGVARVDGVRTTVSSLARYYPRIGQLLLLWLLVSLMVAVGTLLLVGPGIYLAVSYSMAPMLVLERRMGVWAAMETSRKAVGRRWGRYFAVWVAVNAIILVSILPLGVGLVWSLPWGVLAVAEMYRSVFGRMEANAAAADTVATDTARPAGA